MSRNISIYARPLDLQNHECAKLCHKAILGIKEDKKYDLYKEKIENFYMELLPAGQTFYWEKSWWSHNKKIKLQANPFFAYLYLTLNTFTFFAMD